MTASSRDVERVEGQEPQGGAPLAVGAVMLTNAILTFFVGIFALTANELVVAGPGYEYTFRFSAWGWVNLFTAIGLAAVAIMLFVSATGARTAAVIVSCVSIVVSFLWMPYYPVGAVVLIAVDLVVIWGVTTWSSSRGQA